MPFLLVSRLIDFAFEHGVIDLVITGGEPLLHPDFKAISECVRLRQNSQHSTRVVIQTNGILIDEKIIPYLRCFDFVHLSFDVVEGQREQTKHVLDRVNLLKQEGVNCYLFATVHPGNVHLIDLMVKEAQDKNVAIGFNIIQPQNDRAPVLSKHDFWQISQKLFELEKTSQILRHTCPLSAILTNKMIKTYEGIRGGCTAGVASCSVLPNGDVIPCPFFRVVLDNVFASSLEKIWLNNEKLSLIRQRELYDEPCGSCVYLSFCGGCRSRAYKKSGSFVAADPMCPFVVNDYQ